MSVHCRIADVALVHKALQTIVIAKEPWASGIFTPDVLVLHTVGDDQASTATATLPKAMFHEYVVTGEPRFVVHVGALLGLGNRRVRRFGTAARCSSYWHTPQTIDCLWNYGRNRLLQSTLVTRTMKERLLTSALGFRVVARTTLRGDAVTEFLNDLRAECNHVR